MNSTTQQYVIIQLQASGVNGSVYPSLTAAFYSLGHYFAIEMLYLTVYMAASLLGLLGNIFTVFIFFRSAFYSATSPPLFAYMRYEAIVGIVGNISCMIYAFNLCSDLLPFVNTYFSESVLQPNIAIPLFNMSYYAKFLIEIAIVVDRILMLAPTFGAKLGLNRLLKIKRPYFVLIGICAFSFMINYPYIYLVDSAKINTFVAYPGDIVYIIYACYTKTAWSNFGTYGYVVMFFIYIFKTAVTFCVETALNVCSLILFKRHLAQKHQLVKAARKSTLAMAVESKAVTKPSMSGVQTTNGGAILSSDLNKSSGGHKMANMVLLMTITGFIHNLILLVYTIFNLVSALTVLLKTLTFLAYFSTTLRHGMNFLTFYFFNATFAKEVHVVMQKIRCRS